jgi:hypothetical protein
VDGASFNLSHDGLAMKMERELSAPAGLGLAEQQPMWLKLSPPRGSLRRLKLWREGPESSRSRVLEVNLEDRTVLQPYATRASG